MLFRSVAKKNKIKSISNKIIKRKTTEASDSKVENLKIVKTNEQKPEIRKDFGKLAESVELPYLLAIQVNSYNKFLYKSQPDSEAQSGLESAFRSVFPIVSYSGSAALELLPSLISFDASRSVFSLEEIRYISQSSCANFFAIAFPIPLLAPVITIKQSKLHL